MEPAHECKAGAPDWIVTFADLMSLLMTFFILLLSFSNMEIVKFRTMAGSVRNALGLKSDLALSDVPTGNSLLPHLDPKEGEGSQASPEQMKSDLEAIVKESGLEGRGTARVTKRGVILQLNGDMLFSSGRAELNPTAMPILDGLAKYLQTVDKALDVVGHTDDIPISNEIYPSNWELSAARAGQAVRYLAENGVQPRRLRAIGQADSEPISPNTDAASRSENRRVEFVLTILVKPETGDPEGLELGANPEPAPNDFVAGDSE